MARKSSLLPSYLHHKPTGQARCRIDGRDIYLGPFGSEASRIKYGQLVAKLAGGVPLDPMAEAKTGRSESKRAAEIDPGPSVGELCVVFMRHAQTHYTKGGEETSEVDKYRSTIRPLNQLYGLTPVKDFGPLALKAVRTLMIEKGWCRDTINAAVGRIRRIFKFAIENELIGPEVLQRLQAVAPLLAGASAQAWPVRQSQSGPRQNNLRLKPTHPRTAERLHRGDPSAASHEAIQAVESLDQQSDQDSGRPHDSLPSLLPVQSPVWIGVQ